MSFKTDTSIDSSEPLLESGLVPEKSITSARRCRFTHNASPIKIALFFLGGLGLFAIGVVVGRVTVGGVASHELSSVRTGSGFPWRESLSKLTAKHTRFDGSLYPRKGNKYRGAPSKEIDDAWDRFTTNPWMVETAAVLNVTAQEAAASLNDRAFDTVVQLDDENGGGYMGTLEVFHQLHCLNILRKWTYVEHYSAVDPFWAKQNDHRREHTDHCIDMVRQALMCNSDTGLILFHWVKGMPVPSPDFHTMHQCLDAENVLDWALTEAAPISRTIKKPEGAKQLEHFL